MAVPPTVTAKIAPTSTGASAGRERRSGRVAMSRTTPNHARALASPAVAAARTASGSGAVAVTAPAALNHTNEARTQPALRQVGRHAHSFPDALLAAPRGRTAAMARAGGRAAKNRKDTCEMACPASTITHGTNSTMAME